ncbi:ParB/RepB/Spo0J family partition protein [Marinobacterium lutimaris]|uniref:PRTRC system ParB family protein n=1 Tax=Marinobacterium lutimaris TaxID=568106 RepID=A0A1H6DXY3_9GAMM|nr:ParB/RepB/Spo0J family partition protein [Marinobacterium lutimaris]SEG89445.1 PRTRC system ParB family protein [Marinobacterium lutimaris]
MNVITQPRTENTLNAQAQISLTEIHLDFENSRRRIDPETLATMKESINQLGLLQPLVVTPRGEGKGYVLVAGFTRFQALTELAHSHANCTIIEGDAHTILESHVAENTNRQDLSLVSSVTAIRRLATKLGGDYEEVGKRLGFSKKAMDDRLALAKCTESVLDALDEGKLKLGHAVILSAFTHAMQDRTLEKILAEGWTVEALRERAGKARIRLEIGRFDKKECEACPYNSDACAQNNLFGEDIPKGVCSNAQCFGVKQKVWLDEERIRLSEQYGTLLDATTIDNQQIRRVDVQQLGEVQHTACQSCQHNVCIFDDRLNSRSAGSVREQVCNNIQCFDSKVEALRKPATDSASTTQGSASKGTPTKSSRASSAKVATPAPSATLGNKQQEVAEEMLAQHISDSFPSTRIEGLYLSYMAAQALCGKRHEGIAHLIGKSEADVLTATRLMVTDYLTKCSENTQTGHSAPRGILHELAFNRATPEVQIVESWKPHTLKHYPTAQVARLCTEAGFHTQYDQTHGDGAFNKLAKGKKSDLLAAIDTSDFDWTNYAPAAYRAHFTKKLPKKSQVDSADTENKE